MESEEIKASESLKLGSLIIFPFDNVWVVGCDANRKEAIAKIQTLQHYSQLNSSIMVDDVNKIANLADLPDVAINILEVTTEPLTIIYPNAFRVSENIVNSDGSVAISVTHDVFCKKLIRQFRKPVFISVIFNSEQQPCFKFKDIPLDVIAGVQHVVEYRKNGVLGEILSGIIKVENSGVLKVIRE